jgi:hypothetical protein
MRSMRFACAAGVRGRPRWSSPICQVSIADCPTLPAMMR